MKNPKTLIVTPRLNNPMDSLVKNYIDNLPFEKIVLFGDNSILGAGCVIHKDIPTNSIIISRQDQKIIPL